VERSPGRLQLEIKSHGKFFIGGKIPREAEIGGQVPGEFVIGGNLPT